MPQGLRTLIVGAGLAGLALATALRHRGLAADVVERRAADPGDGAGIHLAGNAVRALARLGVADALTARSHRAEALEYTNAAGERLFRVDLRAAFPAATFLGAHRADLRALLLEAAGPDTVRFEASLAGLEDLGDRVEVAFEDGSHGSYDLVVGADGVGSPIRRRLFPESRAEAFSDYWSWRFVCPCPSDLVEPRFMLGVERTALLFPIGEGRLYCGAGPIRVPGGPPEGAALLPWLRDAFAEFGSPLGEALAHVEGPEALAASRVWSVRQTPWHRGRVVLIGDAAHACPPTLAQGAALALEDALVLADELSEGAGISGTLAAFERRRRPRVEAVQAASESRMTVTEVAAPGQLAVRDALLRRVGAERLLAGWRPLVDEEP